MTRRLLASAVVLLAVQAAGCGAGVSHIAARTGDTGVSASSRRADAGAALSDSTSRHYLNDGDNDPQNDDDLDNRNGKTKDDDSDVYEDFIKPGNDRYHDLDDRQTLAYGHPASAAVVRSVVDTVKRYYAAAGAEDAATACAMIVPTLARSVAEDYGHGSAGPLYLRAGTTCRGVMTLLFEHLHSQLIAVFDVTDVRVLGNRARVLLGSSALPAGYIDLEEEAGVWKVVSLLGAPFT